MCSDGVNEHQYQPSQHFLTAFSFGQPRGRFFSKNGVRRECFKSVRQWRLHPFLIVCLRGGRGMTDKSGGIIFLL